jgi:O-Antigen ligase
MKSAGSNLYLDSAFFLKVIAVLAAALVSLFVGWFIVSYPNPFTTTILLAAVVMNAVAIVSPRSGLYLLVVTTGYLDLVKRLGILTDSLSGLDITVTLAVAPLLMLSIWLGVVVKNILEKRKLERWQWLVSALIIMAVCGAAIESFRGGAGFLGGAQSLVNSSGYLPLILITSMIFPEPKDALKILRFALWVFLPVALYSIWQQIFGLSNFEVRFLESGYTITVGDLDDIRPRPFSTLNSPHALSVCTAILAGIALLVPLKAGKRPLWQYAVALIYIAGCVATFGRSGIFIIPIFLIGWLCFRSKWSTFAFYGTILGGLLLLMVNAEPVLDSLGSLQKLLPMDNDDISAEVFRLGTFSERLMSFHNALTNPQFHTLFGNPDATKQDDENSYDETVAHDQITQTLVRYGFVGLVVSGIIAICALWIAHRTVLNLKDRTIREIAIALLSVVTSVVYSGMLFGSHLDLFPVDFFFALLVGILVLCCSSRFKFELELVRE